MSINAVQEFIPQLIMLVGALAFIVSVVTEVMKNIGPLANMPTDIFVFVLSIVLTVVAVMAFAEYKELVMLWYWYVATVLLGFFVSFIAMFGWSKLTELWSRFKPTDIE